MNHRVSLRARPRRSSFSPLLFTCLLIAALLLGCEQPSSPLPKPSQDSRLASLSPSAGTLVPAFDAAVTDYTIAVGNEVTSITLSGTAADGKAKLAGANGVATELPVGTTDITIVVSAEDGITTTAYTVAVTRAPEVHLLSFYKNSGDAIGEMEGINMIRGSSLSLPANVFTRAGFGFGGWATSPAGSPAYADKASCTMGSADIRLYAVWTAGATLSVSLAASGSGALSFSGSTSLAKGQRLLVSVENEGLGSFAWYLDGIELEDQTGASLDLATTGLVSGPHYLMVLASDASGLSYSAGLTVKVTN